MISKLLSVSVLATVLVTVTLSTPVQAKPKTYKCESYKTIDGQWRYRISPPLQGSFISGSLCFIPVSQKECKYNNKGSASSNTWYKCGRTPALDRGEFDFSEGIGEIREDNNGKKYYTFFSGVQFTFE